MRDITRSVYFRAVDSDKALKEERLLRKRRLLLSPIERPRREETITNSNKYSRMKK